MAHAAKIRTLAAEVLDLAREQGIRIVTAESCTGGLVAGALTEIAGSSDVFERGFVTYSNEAKHELLGVGIKTLDELGAVSAETASAMASGALRHSRADLAISITGVAGPGGGTAAKPVGLVHFAAAHRNGSVDRIEKRFGASSRTEIRAVSVIAALTMLRDMLLRTGVQSA